MSGLELTGPANAPVLVLSNALGATADMWRDQLPAFAERFRVIRYEHQPLASVPALTASLTGELDKAGVQRVSFCGLSLGAMVGMTLAIDSPERVNRLVLACTAARFGEPADWQEKAARVRAAGMRAAAEEALELWLGPGHPERERFLRMQLDTDPEFYARGLEAIGGFDFRARLGEIQAPTLVLAGELDRATIPADGRLVADGIPDAAFAVVPGAAHIANADAPGVFNGLALEHLLGCSDPLKHVRPAISPIESARFSV